MATNIIQNTEGFARKSADHKAQPAAGRAELTPERVRDRAYFIFLARAGRPGNPEADWIQAEKELRVEASGRPPGQAGAGDRGPQRSNGAGNPAGAGGANRRNPVMFSGG